MGEIQKEYLPPKEYLPKRIYTLPEVQYPYHLNIVRSWYDRVKDWNKVAIYYENEQITNAELRKEVSKLANGLKSIGVEKNDRVMLRAPNCPEFIYAFYACWAIGAVPVMATNMLRAPEIIYRANDSEAKVFICSSDTWLEMDKAIPEFKTVENVVVLGERKEACIYYDDIIKEQPEECKISDTTRYDIARLIYSSGTTGPPKGIINHVEDLCMLPELTVKYMHSITEKDVIGGGAAFAFALGAGTPSCIARLGCAISIVDRPTPEKMFETIEKHKITSMIYAPTFYNMMLAVENAEKKYDLSSLRVCGSAGEPLSARTRIEWRERFGVDILNFLGSGELCCGSIAMEEGTPRNKAGAMGKVMPGIKVKIVDEDFNEVPIGAFGELIMQGPSGQEYWRRPDVQMKAVHDGWNRLGVIVRMDEDGYFWYQGRTDDMIVSAGYKIPGGEVETILLNHPAVLEAVVVRSPDATRNNVAKAFVVLKKGYNPSDQLKKELQDFVKVHLEPYKYPRKIEFADANKLPRTTTGKILRHKLQEMEERGEWLP